MHNTNEEHIQEIQVIRTASCPSLSGRSTITYYIGNLRDSKYIRLIGNSAGGRFCRDWVDMAKILLLLAGTPSITTKTIQPLYAGKSANSPGFLLAALVHEQLCTTGKENNPATPTPPQKKTAKAKKNTANKIPS